MTKVKLLGRWPKHLPTELGCALNHRLMLFVQVYLTLRIGLYVRAVYAIRCCVIRAYGLFGILAFVAVYSYSKVDRAEQHHTGN